MARLLTIGWDSNDPAEQNVTLSATPPTTGTTQARLGLGYSLISNSGAGNTTSYAQPKWTGAANTTYYTRGYFYLAALPGTTAWLIDITAGVGDMVGLICDTSGNLHIECYNSAGTLVLTTGTLATVTTATWYRIEIAVFTPTGGGAGGQVQFQLDGGSSYDSGTTVNFGTLVPDGYVAGWNTAPGANKTVYVDDVAVNDSSGAAQNSWCGDGKVVMLLPASQNALGTGWQKPGGATTALNTAVDNTPPVFAADSTSAADAEKFVRNATSSATSNLDLNVTDYTTAGVGAGGIITLVQFYVVHGAASATSPPARAARIVSNPAEGADTTLTVPTAAASATRSTWIFSTGPVNYAPAVTKGTAPVLRVGKRTASTRIVDVNFMGIIVEYVPVIANVLPRHPLVLSQAVNRASRY